MISVGMYVHEKTLPSMPQNEKGRIVEELSLLNDTGWVEQLGRLLCVYGEARIAPGPTGQSLDSFRYQTS